VSTATANAFSIDPMDTDADGVLNLFDLDSDGDGRWDIAEMGNPHNEDLDQNGIADAMQDLDNDQVHDGVDKSFMYRYKNYSGYSFGAYSYGFTYNPLTQDHDADGIPAIFDGDEGMRRVDSQGFPYSQYPPDEDENGIADNYDPDHGDDGHANRVYVALENMLDGDADGIPDVFDAADTLPGAGIPSNSQDAMVVDPINSLSTRNACDPSTPTTQAPTEPGGQPAAAEPAVTQSGENQAAVSTTTSGGGGGAAGGLLMLLLVVCRREKGVGGERFELNVPA